jgi:hypothetical protein
MLRARKAASIVLPAPVFVDHPERERLIREVSKTKVEIELRPAHWPPPATPEEPRNAWWQLPL